MRKIDIALIVVITALVPGLLFMLWITGTTPAPRHTCAEIIGVPPRPYEVAIFPPHYSVDMDLAGNVLRVKDETGRIVCGPYAPPAATPEPTKGRRL